MKAGIGDYVRFATRLGGVYRISVAGIGGASALFGASTRGLAVLVFNDDRINAGCTTHGWLDLESSSISGEAKVRIHRLIFDDNSTTAPTGVAYTDGPYHAWQVFPVPEPGSNLALGAGGMTLRRRLKRA